MDVPLLSDTLTTEDRDSRNDCDRQSSEPAGLRGGEFDSCSEDCVGLAWRWMLRVDESVLRLQDLAQELQINGPIGFDYSGWRVGESCLDGDPRLLPQVVKSFDDRRVRPILYWKRCGAKARANCAVS